MITGSLWKYVPPAGPILSLTLIGLLLLSGLLYYRAVKIQRFLEPALAITQPRNEFAASINRKFEQQFGTEPVTGLKVRMSSLVVEKSLVFSEDGVLNPSGRVVLKKLARIFLSLLEDNATRPDISLVLINARFPAGGAGKPNAPERMKVQRMVGLMQDALFQAEPELGRTYGPYFAAAALPAHPRERAGEILEFRIIPSELLHIEVLRKLQKYAD